MKPSVRGHARDYRSSWAARSGVSFVVMSKAYFAFPGVIVWKIYLSKLSLQLILSITTQPYLPLSLWISEMKVSSSIPVWMRRTTNFPTSHQDSIQHSWNLNLENFAIMFTRQLPCCQNNMQTVYIKTWNLIIFSVCNWKK